MWIIYDNIIVFIVSLLAMCYAWLYGGIVASELVGVIPWIWVLVLEGMFFFPQRHSWETTYDARSRVWRNLARDPLTWIVVVFLALLMIPFFNTGVCPNCDLPEIAQACALESTSTNEDIFAAARSMIPAPWLPFCVRKIQHLNVVMWFVPILTALLAVKHSLLKRGKIMLLECVVWNGFVLAILGFVQQVAGAPSPLWTDLGSDTASVYFFSTFGYPNMGGDYFTTIFALSIGLWRWKLDEIKKKERENIKKDGTRGSRKLFWSKHYFLIPAIISFIAALTTLSRASIILVSMLAIVFFAHTFLSYFFKMKKSEKAKVSAASMVGGIGIILFAVFFTPDALQKEVETLDSAAIADRVTGKGQYHTRVSFELWKRFPVFGCGGWGYQHLAIPLMTDDEYAQLQVTGGANVHNDYLQFMAEHGAVGFGLLVTIVVLLLRPIFKVWRSIIDAFRFSPKSKRIARPVAIFAFPAPVFCILMAALATFCHSFGDCPMRSPAVLSLFFFELAAADGFLPKVDTPKEEVRAEEKSRSRHHHHRHHR